MPIAMLFLNLSKKLACSNRVALTHSHFVSGAALLCWNIQPPVDIRIVSVTILSDVL